MAENYEATLVSKPEGTVPPQVPPVGVPVVPVETPPGPPSYEGAMVTKPSAAETPVVVASHVTMMNTSKMYKEGSVLVGDVQTEHPIEIRVPIAGVPMAEVSAEARMTINMGNFESVQIGVSVKLPCFVEEITDAYKAAKKLVDTHLNKEVSDIRQYRNAKGGTANG